MHVLLQAAARVQQDISTGETLKSLMTNNGFKVIPKNGEVIREGEFGSWILAATGEGKERKSIMMGLSKAVEDEPITVLLNNPIYAGEYKKADGTGGVWVRIGAEPGSQEEALDLAGILALTVKESVGA